MRKHEHYFKNVKHLTEIDVYRTCDLYKVDDPSGATQHAIKKLLLPGGRGSKDRIKDLQEASDTILRRIEMLKEDEIGTKIVAGLPVEVVDGPYSCEDMETLMRAKEFGASSVRITSRFFNQLRAQAVEDLPEA